MLQRLVDGLWNEDVWLPPNTTWADLAPGPEKAVVYTDHRHVFVPIPLALVFITLRYLLERLIFAPFGRYLGIKDRKPKKPPPNPKLEAAYKANPRAHQQQVCGLAKQLDMSERQVERWFRLRRCQNKPSTLVKFCENVFKCSFYICNFIFGFVVLWDKDWLWDIDQCYIGYPHQGITNDVWWYYMISAAFYWSLTISQFWDVRRKDFWQMFVHHIATIALLCFSWVCNLHRIGTLVLLLHDCADIFVESVKAAKYARYQKLCDALFLGLIVMWIGTRVGIYPFYIIWSTSIRAPMLLPMFPAYYIFNSLLILLLILHIVWTCLILQIAYYAIKAGQMKSKYVSNTNDLKYYMDGDVRSSSSDLSDSPGHSNHSSPTRNNKKHE
ncbi:ceramide synthase 6-like isoform X1 [Pararge aegeria]|uniref:ceramide synthase 6-like isoform X1 n=1 Tax=Pararge aegeria TaxID=116150 RepID=UPI0019D1438E|nr:ceramide synthase 6-like isoform X1 [Pararge aegeria]